MVRVGANMTELLDTNVILRYLVGDNPTQQSQAKKIFQAAQAGKRNIIIKPLVVAEVCFVLESFYKKSLEEIASSMEIFLSQKWLEVEDRPALLGMWPWYREGLHFVDSYLIASAQIDNLNIITFDKDLEKKVT